MAGKGSEVGSNLSELKTIINNVKINTNIGICLDTCHLHDAGYDLNAFDVYLNEFEKEIGLEYLKCIHLNDSKNMLGTHKDRHANIGLGEIGFNNLLNIVYHDKLKDIPKILETPYVGDSDEDKNRLYPPYMFEIAMLKAKIFDPNILLKIREYYQK